MLTGCLEVLSSLLLESEFAPLRSVPSSLPGRAMPARRIGSVSSSISLSLAPRSPRSSFSPTPAAIPDHFSLGDPAPINQVSN